MSEKESVNRAVIRRTINDQNISDSYYETIEVELQDKEIDAFELLKKAKGQYEEMVNNGD